MIVTLVISNKSTFQGVMHSSVITTLISLHLESWRHDMNNGIRPINRNLSNICIHTIHVLLKWGQNGNSSQMLNLWSCTLQIIKWCDNTWLSRHLWKAKLDENIVNGAQCLMWKEYKKNNKKIVLSDTSSHYSCRDSLLPSLSLLLQQSLQC